MNVPPQGAFSSSGANANEASDCRFDLNRRVIFTIISQPSRQAGSGNVENNWTTVVNLKKHFTIVIYDSRVILTTNLPIP